jgi:hypothetical protein
MRSPSKKVEYFPLTFSHSGLKSKRKALHHFGSIHVAKVRKVFSICFSASMATALSATRSATADFW